MCHSVEMYLPQMTRDAAERRIGEADFTAAERERWVVDAGLGLIGRVAGLAADLTGLAGLLKLEKVSKALKNKDTAFEHDLWLAEHEPQEAGPIGGACARRAGTEPAAVRVRA
ncbi:MAG: hypothetical protein ACE5EU_16120 [Paracoccaceae bacterium]